MQELENGAEEIGALAEKLGLEKLDRYINFTILDIPLGTIILALAIFLFFLLLRKLFSLIIIKSLKALTQRSQTSLDDHILDLTIGPMKFGFIVVGLHLALLTLKIQSHVIDTITQSLLVFLVFWFLYQVLSAFEPLIYRLTGKFGKELSRELGSFLLKSLKIFTVVVGIMAVLQHWGINVSAFVASLGLGGLAFALAAKDTAANLFGSLAILGDQSLKIGDWIKVDGCEGIVEDIGMRTTKIRSFEKSLITVPNQTIANSDIENFSRRTSRRIKMRIGLTYSTSVAQMHSILESIRGLFRTHPGIDRESLLMIRFDQFDDSALSIFVYAFTNTVVWDRYLAIREDINLQIMEIVETHGASFAFPSQSLYVETWPEDEGQNNVMRARA